VRAKFFYIGLDDLAILRRMARPRADVAEAQLFQELADIALVIGHPEALLDDALQVDAPPPHHAVDRKVGTLLHDPRKLRLLLGREPLLSAGAVAFGQPVGAELVLKR
jgi:hypothetical protein